MRALPPPAGINTHTPPKLPPPPMPAQSTTISKKTVNSAMKNLCVSPKHKVDTLDGFIDEPAHPKLGNQPQPPVHFVLEMSDEFKKMLAELSKLYN
mmetsp:Transcript_2151/g.4120  ORF Transcript_2151/g.4120 Transcript_2151/m.4120 type:complete len:96 (-) Transcript_2151:459-746(-)